MRNFEIILAFSTRILIISSILCRTFFYPQQLLKKLSAEFLIRKYFIRIIFYTKIEYPQDFLQKDLFIRNIYSLSAPFSMRKFHYPHHLLKETQLSDTFGDAIYLSSTILFKIILSASISRRRSVIRFFFCRKI